MYHKSIIVLAGLLTAAILLSSCGEPNVNTSDTVVETYTTDSTTSSINAEVSVPVIEIGVSGEFLTFPFKYEELEKLLDLSDCQNVYFEEKGFSVCNVYQGMNRICTLFVTGNVSEHTAETLVTQITIYDPSNGIFTLNGLKDDNPEDFKSIFGESETKSEYLYDHTWGNIVLCVLFDNETGKADSIRLLDMDYPYSL